MFPGNHDIRRVEVNRHPRVDENFSRNKIRLRTRLVVSEVLGSKPMHSKSKSLDEG
jgi:hypothetical protein